jgi:hypothetical protein
VDPEAIQARLRELDARELEDSVIITDEALEGLKFASCLPSEIALKLLAERIADPEAARDCVEELVLFVRL